jgi:cyclophilin family peptidyl-prolyl cis-trans isomerase
MARNLRVFFEIEIASKTCGRLVFELRGGICPRTVENFVGLTLHKRGYGYRGSCIHRIVPGLLIQGGDITRGDGSGGVSIWGRDFRDENFAIHHTKRGILSMANFGPHTNNSQFVVSLSPCPWMERQSVAFGELVDGFAVLDVIESLAGPDQQVIRPVIVSHSGLA